ncbi:MAG: enoyl-CoA hydratase/isomerase family protein [Rhizobiaceae bacterium]
MYETLKFEIADNIATITLSRPDSANALNLKMAEELHEISITCCTNSNIRAVLLTGEGRMFSAGGDLNQFKDAGDEKQALLLHMATILHAAIVRFANMDAPLVVAVNGTAAGGGFSMLLAGDFVIASSRAKLVAAYTASGLTPDGSSTFYLAKHVGLLRAKELLFTNRVLTADEAKDWGLVNQVVEPEELMDAAMTQVQEFANGPTKSYGRLKRMLQTAFSDPMETQLEKETQGIASMMATRDGPHGLEAFLNKQKPKFEGR